MIHDYVFYILLGFMAILSICLCYMNKEDFQNHRVVKVNDEIQYEIKYEEEDPLIIAQGMSSNLEKEYTPYSDDSFANSSHVNAYTTEAMLVIGFILLIYQCVFLGRLFKDGTIRNLIISGISKTRVYLSSFVISLLFLLLFTICFLLFAIVGHAICGNYLIIYWPSYLVMLAAVTCISILTSAITLCFLFLSQNQLLTFILIFSLGVAFNYFVPNVIYDLECKDLRHPFMEKSVMLTGEMPEGVDPFSEEAHDIILDHYVMIGDEKIDIHDSMYWDSSTLGRDLYLDGQLTDYLDYNTPNPDYLGDNYHKFMIGLYKANVYSLDYMSAEFGYYQLVADGTMTTYIVFSAIYTAVFLAAGCIITKKRNIT